MCEIMEKIADENRAEGRAELATMLLGLVNDNILLEEEAAERFGGTFEELEKAAAYLNKN